MGNPIKFNAMKNHRNTFYKVWQDGYHPIELNTNELIIQKLNYIHENPVKAECVFKAEDYVFSSARDHLGDEGVIDVVLLE